MAHLLDIRSLVTRFHTPEGVVHAVNGISYTLDKGESLAIVGESGSGKSVSALSILGLVPSPPGVVEQGEIWFSGVSGERQNLLALSERQLQRIRGKEIGMIFQDPMTSLNPVRTIGSQLMEGLKLHLGLNGRQARDRASEMFTLVGLPNPEARMNDYPHQFSGGQRQRITIAIALSCNPLLLIADEPTTALDVTIQAQMINLVKRLRADLGMGIIWITHDLGVVAGLVDKVAVMYAGYIVELAAVDQLYKHMAHPYTLGLLESIPRLQGRERRRLVPINGRPPSLLQQVTRCPLADRCRYAIDRCWQENPPLTAVSPHHSAACWRHDEIYDGLRIQTTETGTGTHSSPLANPSRRKQ